MINLKRAILCLLTIVSIPSLISCNSSKKEIPAQQVQEIPQNATSGAVKEALNATPSSKEKNKKSGISAENYDKNTFAGYEGQLSFFYNKDGSVIYYKWSIMESDKKKASTIYDDVCTALTGSYGDGIEKNSEGSEVYITSWETENEQITAQKISGDNDYEISYTVVNK